MRILYALNLPVEELRKIGRGEEPLEYNMQFFLFPMFAHYYKQGHEIVLVTASRDIIKQEIYEQPRLKIIIVKLWKHGRLSAFDHFRTDISRIQLAISKEICDVYHAHWCYEYAIACLRVCPQKTWITLHDWPDIVCPAIGNYYWKKRISLGNQALKQGTRFLAVSPYMKDLLESTYPEKKAEVVPNFLSQNEIGKFQSISKKSGNGIAFLCVNNGFSDRKNTKVAMEAFEKLYLENPAIHLDMYGDEYEAGGVAAQWAANHLTDISGITFHGAVQREEIYQAFRTADILIHTSIEESFGLIYLEAMASETAIVAGVDAGATAWVLGPDLSVGLTDVKNAEQVYLKLKLLSEDEKLRAHLQEKGKENLMERFTETVVRAQMEQLYQ